MKETAEIELPEGLANIRLPEELERRVATPALVVYLDRVRHNVRTVIAQAGSADRWRPHVKSSKIPAVMSELCREGLTNFKCATTREARELLTVMRTESVPHGDLLVAYPLTQPALDYVGRLAKEFDEFRISVLCETGAAVAATPDPLSIFVDVNPGMHRTGIPVSEDKAILEVAERAGSRFRGIHYYDGHLHRLDVEGRKRDSHACYDLLMDLLQSMRGTGIDIGEVITSGTPSYLHALAYSEFERLDHCQHRISPGTVVYHDLRSHELEPEIGLLPAALVHARVVSHPRKNIVTCDAGSKSIAAEAGDPVASVIGHPELVAQPPSEEHLPFEVRSGAVPPRGTCLQLFARHICPTVNLADQAILMDAGRVSDIVSVSARAHDLLLDD